MLSYKIDDIELQLPLNKGELIQKIVYKFKGWDYACVNTHITSSGIIKNPFSTYNPREFIILADANRSKATQELEVWLKNQIIQNEGLLASVPGDYRNNALAMERYRENAAKYDETYRVKKIAIEETYALESNPDKKTMDAYMLTHAKLQKRWLDVKIKARRERILLSTMENLKIRREALRRLNAEN